MPLPFVSNKFQYEEMVSEETFLAVPSDHRINRIMPHIPAGEFGRVDMAFFREDAFIMLYPGQRLRELGMDACRAAGFEPNIVFETSYVDSANALVAAGIGISFIPYMILQRVPIMAVQFIIISTGLMPRATSLPLMKTSISFPPQPRLLSGLHAIYCADRCRLT